MPYELTLSVKSVKKKKLGVFERFERFKRLSEDPTNSFQLLVQGTLRKMKKKFSQREYEKLYPSSSRPGLFFGLGKVHNLKEDAFNVNNLPLRPVISNIGTATYEIYI